MNLSFRKFLISAVLVNSLIVTSFAGIDRQDSSNELGLTVSKYQYKEENVRGVSNFATIKATNIGLEYIGTVALDKYWFMAGEAIAA